MKKEIAEVSFLEICLIAVGFTLLSMLQIPKEVLVCIGAIFCYCSLKFYRAMRYWYDWYDRSGNL
jgi:hypothetical protein